MKKASILNDPKIFEFFEFIIFPIVGLIVAYFVTYHSTENALKKNE